MSKAGGDGKIGCGCGKVLGLPDRKTSTVVDGIEHRYGKPCRPAPERAGREGEQALPTDGEGDVMLELVAEIQARRTLGLRRYGKPLQRFNGRDVAKDLQDELLDAAVYARQLGGEVRAIVEALVVLGRYVRDGKAGDAVMEAVKLAEKLEASRV